MIEERIGSDSCLPASISLAPPAGLARILDGIAELVARVDH
jgi:hypothetical protein